ncbi:MAG: D-Ala-D-Ala carboxypeptidase family metallohydrolase [Cyanobacteria bacterium P01_F01_bin.150]
MADLAPDQRNYFYLLSAERVGIHKSILYALRWVHASPDLTDGEKGLGITANQGRDDSVDTFPEQVQYAANTLRSLTNQLVDEGWSGADLWDSEAGRYADKFLNRIAQGYQPQQGDRSAGALAPTNGEELKQRYIEDLSIDYSGDQLPQSLGYLDQALLRFAERVPQFYQKIVHQRDALLEAIRVWRQLNTRDEAIRSMLNVSDDFELTSEEDLVALDRELAKFAANMARFFAGYPHQREALIRLTQLWRQLPSREDAIASLQEDTSPNTDLDLLDPALLAFVKRIPTYYQGRGDQRNAVTEGYRLWHNIPSRKQALLDLGIQQDLFSTPLDPETATQVGKQLDQALLDFIKRVPRFFNEKESQREGLLRMIQLWRRLGARDTAVQSVMDDLKEMERAKAAEAAALAPRPPALPPRPTRWTPRNIQLSASIIPNGNFTWAEATRAGQRMPPNQATVDAMIRIATLAQRARNQIGRPFVITSWYRPPAINRAVGGSTYSRHIVGDAIDYYVEGLTGYDLYRALNPWWPGGLGLYGGNRYMISHIDARNYRARWNHR